MNEPTNQHEKTNGAASDSGIPTGAKAPFFLIMQFFLIPLGVVAACVIVFVLFGLIASEEKSAQTYLQDITGRDFNRRWQAAFELSKWMAQNPKAAEDSAFATELVGVFESIPPGGTDEDPRVRRYLALALGRTKSLRAVPALVRALGDKDAETVLYSAGALGLIGDRGSVPALITVLGHEDAGVRKTAAYVLGSLGDVQAAEPLVKLLEDSSEDVRWNAAIALARLHDARCRDVLHRMLNVEYLDRIPDITAEQKIEARLGAVRALAALGDRTSLDALRRLSAEDTDLTVRSAASEAVRALEAVSPAEGAPPS